MGEVSKAKDTRLDRIVAVKVLSERHALDDNSRTRFARKSRAISSLNHPHICTVHDVGHDARIDYFVMEYVQGETLAERWKKGALPLAQALEYAAQIGDALDKAHRAGVVHRDLKPANVMLSKAGTKLLDFGRSGFSSHPRGCRAGRFNNCFNNLTREIAGRRKGVLYRQNPRGQLSY
jgi:serine/threonine protein kinase